MPMPLLLLATLGARPAARPATPPPPRAGLRFEVTLGAALAQAPVTGRLFVVAARSDAKEPRLGIGRTGMDADPVFAHDVARVDARRPGVIDGGAAAFPLQRLADLPRGRYVVQAVLDTNQDLKGVNAPGNLYSRPVTLQLDPASARPVRLQLTERLGPDTLPADTDVLRYVKIRSEKLSRFWERPIYLRAGVILPRGYAADTATRYPLRVHIGGYGARYTGVARMMQPGSDFATAWADDATPKMLTVMLDGDGPLGDPYQVNSVNHGPYGDAVTQELLPYIERTFRGLGTPQSRFLDGGSTGGWVSFALQLFYPDYFNGTWSSCPDGVDFHGFQLVDVYADTNAYVNRYGFERPSMREVNGEVRFTMRHELQLENLLGAGDSWTMSGSQWGAWNATYGPRHGPSRAPVALWDPKTGHIDRSIAESWKTYDLRLRLVERWPALATALRGKLHIAVGDADNFFLNNAVHMLDSTMATLTPAWEGAIVYGPGKGHCWQPLSEQQLMQAMAGRLGGAR